MGQQMADAQYGQQAEAAWRLHRGLGQLSLAVTGLMEAMRCGNSSSATSSSKNAPDDTMGGGNSTTSSNKPSEGASSKEGTSSNPTGRITRSSSKAAPANTKGSSSNTSSSNKEGTSSKDGSNSTPAGRSTRSSSKKGGGDIAAGSSTTTNSSGGADGGSGTDSNSSGIPGQPLLAVLRVAAPKVAQVLEKELTKLQVGYVGSTREGAGVWKGPREGRGAVGLYTARVACETASEPVCVAHFVCGGPRQACMLRHCMCTYFARCWLPQQGLYTYLNVAARLCLTAGAACVAGPWPPVGAAGTEGGAGQ
jgi:hypothetical protein